MMIDISCPCILAFLWSGDNHLQGPDQSDTKPVVRNKEYRLPSTHQQQKQPGKTTCTRRFAVRKISRNTLTSYILSGSK